MRKGIFKVALMLMAFSIIALPASAQKKKKKKKGEVETPMPKPKPKPKKPASKIKDIEDVAKACRVYEGLFTIYQDTASGTSYFQVNAEQIDKEFIYFSVIKDGSLFAGHFRGAYGSNDIFTIKRHYDNIEFVKENTSFYFDDDNALSKAADANISPAVLLSESIYAQDSTKQKFLIKADGFLLAETLVQLSFRSSNPFAFSLGRLSRDKKKYLGIKAYPENTDVAVELVYDNPSPRNYGGPGITDPRYVSVKMQHSFIAIPDNGYEPRYDDPRLGYFSTYLTDMTATDATPYRDMISRWHLVKKDPSAAMSEPVEPITWWVENTTPLELRDAVKEGILAWNKAFEKAGFKNAVVAKIQPDDAEWDADDIRYNVVRWTSSPVTPFRGYGPSFTNPRTGQILGADVMMEYALFRRVTQEGEVFGDASVEGMAKEYEALKESFSHGKEHVCAVGNTMSNSFAFGQQFAKFQGLGTADADRMKAELVKWVTMHEVGHTLGLSHNMKASQINTPAQLQDMERTGKLGLIGSVMDYPTINLSKDKAKQGHYYSPCVGPYDEWVIQYGYTPGLSEKELEAIAAKSSDPLLAFGNDADDMRSPGKAIDPRVMIWDISSDVVGYSSDRMDLAMDMMGGLKDKYKNDGESYQEMRSAFFLLWGEYLSAANVSSRYIGGVYVDRAFQGQEGATKPFTPVAADYQKKAMALLRDKVFAPNAFDVPDELFNYLQIQRRGFNLFSSPEDPKIHAYTLAIQEAVLAHIIHPNTLQRMIDSEVYGNEYSLSAFMTDLNGAIFDADKLGNVNTFRQNLQLEYTKQLVEMIGGKYANRYANQAKSMALYNLQQIRKIATNGRGDLTTKAHKAHLKVIIDKALDTK